MAGRPRGSRFAVPPPRRYRLRMPAPDSLRRPARRYGPPTVLIADDDPVVARLLAELVRQQGWRPMVAADAMQAVMFAVRGEPAAIVLDIMMPGGTGLHALRQLKSNAKTTGIPVIVLSGSADPDLPATVQQLGATTFLAKPLDADRMRDELAALMGAAD
jgi:CheY-like chemotaxis protein